MNAYSVRTRLYLVLVAAALNAFGISFFLNRARLAYGDYAPHVLALAIVASVGPLLAWVRTHELARALVEARHFRMSPEAIPVAEDGTYVGSGFEWTARHAERLTQLQMQEVEVAPATSREYGGNWFLHGLGGADEQPLFVPNHLLTQHTLILGTTGVGKTRTMELLIIQAIQRGDAIVVIDPKGDERLLNRVFDECRKTGREDEFRLFALPYPYKSVRYNPLSHYVQPHEIADRIASLLPSGGDSQAFRNYAYGVVNTVAGALHECGEPITLYKILRYSMDFTWDLVRLFIRRKYPMIDKNYEGRDAAEVYEGLVKSGEVKSNDSLVQLIQLARKDRTHYEKMITSLLPILTKLTTDQNKYLLSPDTAEDEAAAGNEAAPELRATRLTWSAIDRNRLVCYFFLGSMLGYDTANAVAKMTLADFQSYVGAKYAYEKTSDYGRISLFVDELADVVTPATVNIINKSRGAEVAVCFAGQAMADLEAALGSPAEARRVLGNMNTVIQFRAQNALDAQLYSDLAGNRQMRLLDESFRYEPGFFSSGLKSVDDFRATWSQSARWHEQPIIPPWAVLELPKFHFLLRYSGKVFKGQVPLLDKPETAYLDDVKGGMSA